MAVNIKNQNGVGLIEILITVVILSVGFLAAARMQVEGMRFSQSAYFQSQAYFLANDMINRMRTNSDGVLAGNYNNVMTSASSTDPGCATSPCNAAAIARQDVYEWGGYFHPRDEATSFVPALPSSDLISARATVLPLNDDLFVVELFWSEIIGGEYIEQNLSINFALAKWE